MNHFQQRVSYALWLAAHEGISLLCKLALARRGYVSLFDRRPREAHPPDWSDLWFIYRMIRERKPRKILEFGSGCSTIIMAQALADNTSEGAPGFVYSIDAKPDPGKPDWGQVTIDSMPDELKHYCKISVTPVLLVEYEGKPVWRFQCLPDISPDFIYMDGPGLAHSHHKVAIDVLTLEPKFGPGFRLLVDGRLKNCEFLEKYFKKNYQKRYQRLLHSTTYDLLSDEAVLSR